MGRIVGFIGAGMESGVSDICYELSKNISERESSVCVVDFYFSMNNISEKFEMDKCFDLKDYLIGRIGIDGILCKAAENLFFIKSNNARFDYLKYKADIEYLIKQLSRKFDYILIDVNSFDYRIIALALSAITEVCLVFDNEQNSISKAARLIKIIREKSDISMINLVMNKSRIMGQLAKKYLSRLEIENLLGEDIMFEFPKFYKDNYLKDKNISNSSRKLGIKFCNSFITNKILHINYFKNYKGLIGRIKRSLYERFE